MASLILLAVQGIFVFAAAEGLPNELGRAVYTNCAACHGIEGQGGFAPPLAANERIQDTEYLIVHILKGSAVMPGFKDQLSSDEIAAVVNHVRNSWGNRAANITAAEVVAVEQRLGS